MQSYCTHRLTCMHINAKLLHTHTHMYAYKCRVFVHGSHSQDGWPRSVRLLISWVKEEEFKIILKHSTNGSIEEPRSPFLSYNEGRGAGLEKYCKKKRKAFNSISMQNHNPSKCIPVFLTWEDDVCWDRVIYGEG